MANLPLRTRRRFARGFNKRNLAKRGYGATLTGSGYGGYAHLTTALAGANNDLTFTARTPGTGGNAITVAYVVSGNNTPLSVAAAGNAITVTVATDGSAAATSTAEDVKRAVNNSTTVGPLVWAQDAAGSDGTGVVTALTATSLAGGAAGG